MLRRDLRVLGCLSAVVGLAAAGELRGDVRAAIDVAGATLETGSAPVQGTVVIDGQAALGSAPAVAPDESPYDEDLIRVVSPEVARGSGVWVPHRGLGGADLRVSEDLTLPGGTYDFASLEVARGATLRFTGPATVRLTGEFRLEGQVVLDASGELQIETRGAVRVHGRDDAVETGVFATEDESTIRIVGGTFQATADAGARARFRADGQRGQVLLDADAGTLSLEDVLVEAWRSPEAGTFQNRPSLVWANGAVVLRRTTFTGGGLGVWADHSEASDGVSETLTVDGCSFEHAGFWSWGHATFTDTTVDAPNVVELRSERGSIRLDGTQITADGRLKVQAWQDVRLGEGTVLLEEDDPSTYPGWLPARRPLTLVRAFSGAVELEPGARIEHRSTDRLLVSAATGIVVRGEIRSAALRTELSADAGDVELDGGAEIVTPDGPLRIWAAGAVFAHGGTAVLSAPEYDVRCITGDLDLSVQSMEATSGRIVALSKGLVRLRGTYRAARDIQVISVLDSVDVRGARLETADVGDTLSGFVRLATYAPWAYVAPIPADGEDDWSDEDDDDGEAAKAAAAADGDDVLHVTLDAADAFLRSGDSRVRSGDVLVQTAESSSTGPNATLRASRTRARKLEDGTVQTEIRGTLKFAPATVDLDMGTARLTAGAVSRRTYLVHGHGQGTSATGTVRFALGRTTRRKASFTVTVTESDAPQGATARFGLDRPGLHARTTFRRPRVR